MKELAKGFINEIQSWDKSKILIEPTKYSLSLKHTGKVFAYFEPRRKFFLIYTYNEENKWTPFKIETQEDLSSVKNLIKYNLDKK